MAEAPAAYLRQLACTAPCCRSCIGTAGPRRPALDETPELMEISAPALDAALAFGELA